MKCDQILTRLKRLGKPGAVEGMARYGIKSARAYGVPAPELRKLAKEIGCNHELALELFDTGVHDAKALAALVDDPDKVSKSQMDSWSRRFNNWGDCDACSYLLFDRTQHAYYIAIQWSGRKREFVKRSAFAIMAGLAVHDKTADDKKLAQFLPIIERESIDERHFVKKAVNWALRQIGKRNMNLNRIAIETAERVAKIDSRSARWIASDALRELRSDKVRS